MTDAKVIPFPRPPIEEKIAPRVVAPDLSVAPMVLCDGYIHVFASVPGRCQCGAELWIEAPPA